MTGTDNERELQWQRHHPDVRGSWQWQRGVRTLIRLGGGAATNGCVARSGKQFYSVRTELMRVLCVY